MTATEFDTKQARLQALLAEHHLDALLLQHVSSFAWATCGADSHINTADSYGVAALLITPTHRYLITNNIEKNRFAIEQRLAEQDWEFHITPWHEASRAIAQLTHGLTFGADSSYPGAVDLSDKLIRLRSALTPQEGDRFRTLGCLCAEAIGVAAHQVQPGQTEYQIAGLLAHEAESRGVQAIVNLIATDERIYNYRHPLSTGKKLERYAMLVLCGRQQGLICSVTRLVHFGRLPDELRHKVEAVAQVDATVINATRPGISFSAIFNHITAAYAAVGFPDEWTLHHQGGLAGYEPREVIATPDSDGTVSVGQAFAWNPSITGTKSEDTILVGEHGNEILTAVPNWPTVSVAINGHTFERPAILEVV